MAGAPTSVPAAGKRYFHWQLDDPPRKGMDAVHRPDALQRRVTGILDQLGIADQWHAPAALVRSAVSMIG